ncbi:mechanosensitive ion channel family protein [Alphaproteobacteria bacterium LSUCC0684]
MDMDIFLRVLDRLDFSTLMGWTGNALSGFLILAIGIFISRRINQALRKNLGRIKGFDKTLIPLAASVTRYAILLVALVAALGSFGIQTTSIIAVLGAAGLAIGLAIQGTLSNVASGVMLILLRPFQVGDWIESASHSGTVTEVGLFTTVITTFDNVFISVPNSTIWSDTIINHSRNDTRRMDIDIGIAYNTDLDLAEKTLLSLAEDERVLKEPAAQFLVVRFEDSAIVVRLRLYARNDVYWQLYWDLMRKVKPVLDRASIEIPFPQREYRQISG